MSLDGLMNMKPRTLVVISSAVLIAGVSFLLIKENTEFNINSTESRIEQKIEVVQIPADYSQCGKVDGYATFRIGVYKHENLRARVLHFEGERTETYPCQDYRTTQILDNSLTVDAENFGKDLSLRLERTRVQMSEIVTPSGGYGE